MRITRIQKALSGIELIILTSFKCRSKFCQEACLPLLHQVSLPHIALMNGETPYSATMVRFHHCGGQSHADHSI